MNLSEIGEREIIDGIIKKKFFPSLDLDDCAVLNFNGKSLVISVDQAFTNPFVLKIGGTFRELGRLFVTQNVSDIAAMGCKPIGFLFCVSMPKSFNVKDFELLLSGIKQELKYYSIPLLGGDTKEADKLYLSGTILGEGTENKILRRIGAQVNDIICLSKPIGKCFSNYIDFANSKVKRIFTPKADVKLGEMIADSGLCNSCIDTSDGLFASLKILAETSELTFNINLDKVKSVFPKDYKDDIEWGNYISNVGGDFGLLFTLKNSIKSELFINEHNLLQIGYVSKSDQKITFKGKYAKNYSFLPWEHFSNLESFKVTFDKFIKKNVYDL